MSPHVKMQQQQCIVVIWCSSLSTSKQNLEHAAIKWLQWTGIPRNCKHATKTCCQSNIYTTHVSPQVKKQSKETRTREKNNFRTQSTIKHFCHNDQVNVLLESLEIKLPLLSQGKATNHHKDCKGKQLSRIFLKTRAHNL